MARYHGKRGLVYMSTTAGGVAVSVAGFTDWTLDQPSDMADATVFGDPNKEYTQGIPDCKGTINAVWDDTNDTLYDASRSDDGVNLYLYPSSLVLTKYWYGQAWIDFSISVGVGDTIKSSGNWAARGAWGQM